MKADFLSPVLGLLSPVSCSRLLSPVSCLPSPVSRLPSPASVSCLQLGFHLLLDSSIRHEPHQRDCHINRMRNCLMQKRGGDRDDVQHDGELSLEVATDGGGEQSVLAPMMPHKGRLQERVSDRRAE